MDDPTIVPTRGERIFYTLTRHPVLFLLTGAAIVAGVGWAMLLPINPDPWDAAGRAAFGVVAGIVGG